MSKIAILVLSFLFLSGCTKHCTSFRKFDFKPGLYELDHPKLHALDDALGESSVTVGLSGHAGISFPANAKDGKGGISIVQLRNRLEKILERRQATILLEKNFTGEFQLDKKVLSLLKELGFKIVIIRIAVSEGTYLAVVFRY